MNAADLVLELRRLADAVVELRHLVLALSRERDALTPAQRRVLESATKLFALGETFTASQMVDASRFDRDAEAALRRACDLDVQRLGIVLGQLADSGVIVNGARLARLPREAGSRRWALEAVDPL